MKEILYVIWVIYVTIAVLTALVQNPGIIELFLAIFVWAVMVLAPGVVFEKR